MGLLFIDGNQAVAMGAMHAGCRFFASYPITPASNLLSAMLETLPAAGGIALQGEDEIASIGYCLGASMAGMKVMTATSGPGFSLYSENISFAIAGEIPIVIVNIMRQGPSTGSATRGADGDVQFMRWGCSGGLPVIVLAPADVSDCFALTVHAFNLAEQFRCPVIIASNKEIGMTSGTLDMERVEKPMDTLQPIPRRFRQGLKGCKEKSILRQNHFPTSICSEKQNIPVSLLVLKTLWPVPEQVLRAAAVGMERILVVEMNLGQYLQEIRRVLCNQRVDFYGKMSGQLLSPSEIIEEVTGG
jgi:pyruvate/2-oxoacid:ferredoxin oxidoreductase alpha subunit